jgi:hypothetical protein
MHSIYIRLVIIAALLLPLTVGAAEAPAVGFTLRSSNGFSGNLSNGSWLFEQVEPGQYTYSVSSPSFDGQDSITVNVTAGQTYYLKGEIKWGWPAGRTKFSSMPESSGQAELAKLK